MDWMNEQNNTLIRAILALQTPDEARRFLRDLMTEREIEEFGKRLQAAEMLTKKISYATIEKKTGLSSTTVARVSKWLNSKEGGYRTIIGRLHHRNSIQTGRGLS
jgi:TrpR-related protein YerC/YecD